MGAHEFSGDVTSEREKGEGVSWSERQRPAAVVAVGSQERFGSWYGYDVADAGGGPFVI